MSLYKQYIIIIQINNSIIREYNAKNQKDLHHAINNYVREFNLIF